ncbi:putative protein without homology [Propionibacterium freudenreichii subsp. shermanii]|nr:putative protein without homology [Propionibacterium freudenreichii subsp. shermanii]
MCHGRHSTATSGPLQDPHAASSNGPLSPDGARLAPCAVNS